LKKLIAALLVVLAATFTFISPAFAGDVANGASVFSANCAQCHAGGKNLVNPQKTLQKADLEKYGMFSEQAIINQVTNGKNAMPALGSRLNPDQIADVAAYVLSQAEKGW
jgi:cytochrome c6